jgi:tRNA (guanosine-2'-O-)-methyltransferase
VTAERLEKLRAVVAKRQPTLSVIMENVHKPHNFAAVVRTCDAVGIGEAHAQLKAHMAASITAVASSADKWVKIHQHDTIAECAAAARARGMKIVAAHLSAKAVDFRSYDYTQPTAILLGQELGGVTEEALALVDAEVVIPMVGLIASLNVSVAAAVILYEAQRQREVAGMYAKAQLPTEAQDKLIFELLHPMMAEKYASAGKPYPPIDADGHIVHASRGNW